MHVRSSRAQFSHVGCASSHWNDQYGLFPNATRVHAGTRAHDAVAYLDVASLALLTAVPRFAMRSSQNLTRSHGGLWRMRRDWRRDDERNTWRREYGGRRGDLEALDTNTLTNQRSNLASSLLRDGLGNIRSRFTDPVAALPRPCGSVMDHGRWSVTSVRRISLLAVEPERSRNDAAAITAGLIRRYLNL